ncbi:dynamin family protein [Pseudogulbenkiania sp. NH8B]|uniref:dynamin family protein n=1 Tax=Pseudogulbenkiania sp. (strain NH8B) TaxID=748280 RepID=UPI0002279C62|nr:dynamin family protein [Pseudogulbenkiania sp. NH8B]BAK77609.1 dynamin family protein [Pseudogulbenkiania sp. NH8B]
MQENSVSRDELMTSFQRLQAQFDRQRSDIRDKEDAFDQARDNFAERLQKRRKDLSQMLDSNNPLRVLGDDLTRQLDEIFRVWEKQVTARAKGTRFRKGLGDSLLVFIYGKVKSGKSSLGNYMAWGHSEPDALLKAHAAHPPEYFSTERTDVANGDQEGDAKRNRQFRVGATEATSSIQGFRLPGLTWVDSPGLHSVNARNGDLAKEYVEHADLILYTMSSQAPGRASDMEEIAELLAANKKIMVLLTGSDTTDEDEDENGEIITTVVMKDLSDLRDQIAYVQSELKKLGNSASILAEVLPISTRYAERNPVPEGMATSGMGRLLHELQNICHGPALDIKLNTPMENLRSSIRSTTLELDDVRKVVDKFSAGTARQDEALQRELAELGAKGASEMREHIHRIFNTVGNDNLEETLRKQAVEVIAQQAHEALVRIGEQQQQGLRQAFDRSRLGSLPEYQEITVEKEYFSGTRKGTKSWFGLGGAIAGGAVGFILGGPAGAALGASLGASASTFGRSAGAEYSRHQVVVGDNREELRQAALDNYAKKLPELIAEHVNTLYTPLRAALQEYCKTLDSDMTELKIKLEQLAKVD